MTASQIGRLAFRAEGSMWVAYYALPGTMEGALLLGSISMQLVRDSARKQAFMDLMRSAMTEMLTSVAGRRPEWNDPVTAPEHEMGGSA